MTEILVSKIMSKRMRALIQSKDRDEIVATMVSTSPKSLDNVGNSAEIIAKIACFLYSFERFSSNFGFEIIPKRAQLLVQLCFAWNDACEVSMESFVQLMKQTNALMAWPFSSTLKFYPHRRTRQQSAPYHDAGKLRKALMQLQHFFGRSEVAIVNQRLGAFSSKSRKGVHVG